MEIAKIIDKPLKTFKWKWGGNILGSSGDVGWLGAVARKSLWEQWMVWEARDLCSNPFSAINQLRRPEVNQFPL